MQDRFFVTKGFRLEPGLVELDPLESEHAVRTRRLRVGDRATLLDGDGAVGNGFMKIASKSRCVVEVESVERFEPTPPFVTIAVSWPRGPRADSLVDACAELGVVRIIPLTFERSVAVRDDFTPARVARVERIAREACKQSGSPFLLQVDPATGLDALCTAPFDGQKFALHPSAGAPSLSSQLGPPANPVLLVIGPEGGMTEREVASLRASQFIVAHLGPSLLRIEMAAIAAASIARLR